MARPASATSCRSAGARWPIWKGLKIRVPQLRIWVDFWTLLGAAPTPLPYSEQYSALSTGIIDAIDSDVFSIVGFKFYEQANNLT
jgi:TRAP-type transport system periplasmic protein